MPPKANQFRKSRLGPHYSYLWTNLIPTPEPNACQRVQTGACALLFSSRMHTESGPADNGKFGQAMRGGVGGTTLFKRFTLQEVLGRGEAGIVWLAHDEHLDRLVALKLVPEAVCLDPSARGDLKLKTRKSLLLTHPNI